MGLRRDHLKVPQFRITSKKELIDSRIVVFALPCRVDEQSGMFHGYLREAVCCECK